MPSSGYTAVTFVADQLLTSTIMNQMAANDAAFNNGNGFNDNIIVARHYGAASIPTTAYQASSVTPNKLDTPFQGLSYFFNPAFTTTSGSAVDITGMTKTITTKGGGLVCFFCLPIKVSTNTASIYLVVDGVIIYTFQTSTLSTLYIPNLFKVDGLTAGSHTVKLQCSIPGGATFTCQIYESGALALFEVGNS